MAVVNEIETKLGSMGPMMMEMSGVLADSKRLVIKQEVNYAEAFTFGCYEAENRYTIFNGDAEDGTLDKILIASAKSPCIERMCCAPFHSVIVKIMDPRGEKTYLSIERKGFGSGRYLMPCCCACNEDYCNDGIVVHEGEVEYEEGICCGCLGQEVTTEGKGISKIAQASTLTPQLNVFAEVDSEEPYATITGPCCFGGCSELCCESVFEYKKGDTPIATMSKLAPKSCCECCKEMCTDVDKFAVEFEDGIEAEEKANSMAAVFLSDYMFFEKDHGMCTCKNGAVIITCFQCYCFGCLVPCNLEFKGNSGGGGGGAPLSKPVSDGHEDKKLPLQIIQPAVDKSPEAAVLDRSI